MSNSVILHIGLHKTATSSLQGQFFPACNGARLLTTLVPEMRAFVHYVTRTDPLYFDRKYARSIVGAVLDPRQPNVLSNESFSGPPYSGAIEGGLDHRTPVLQNLAAVFPDAQVILVLRRQDGFARSMYRQYLKSGGTRGIRRFYGLSDRDTPPLFPLDRFLYSRYVDAVGQLFPAGMLVLPFEELLADQALFLRRIVDFVGIPLPDIQLRKENATSLGPLGMEFTRLLNHLFRSLLNPAGLLPGVSVRRGTQHRRISPVQFLHDYWPGSGAGKGEVIGRVGEEILELAREDNRRLNGRYGLDLARYGYC